MITAVLTASLFVASLAAPQQDRLDRTLTVGGSSRPNPFEHNPSGGSAILIGLRVITHEGKYVKSVQPLYLLEGEAIQGQVYGHGDPKSAPVELRAKEGYAVGAIHAKAGGKPRQIPRSLR